MTADGSTVLVPKCTSEDSGKQRFFLVGLDRSLKEKWSYDLRNPNGCDYVINEKARKIAVCATGRESVWVLDFEGKVLSTFTTDVGGITHHIRMSEDGGCVIVWGGYELELFHAGKPKAIWKKTPLEGLRQYDVASADISPDGKMIVAAFCQIIPGRRAVAKSPRYMVCYDGSGKIQWQKTLDGADYTYMGGPGVQFVEDGRGLLVQEERVIRLIELSEEVE